MLSTALSRKLENNKKGLSSVFQEAKVDHINSEIAYFVFYILIHTSPKAYASPFMHSQ